MIALSVEGKYTSDKDNAATIVMLIVTKILTIVKKSRCFNDPKIYPIGEKGGLYIKLFIHGLVTRGSQQA